MRPGQAPFVHTLAQGLPVFCQLLFESHVCGCRPLHCIEPGTQVPVQAPCHTGEGARRADALPAARGAPRLRLLAGDSCRPARTSPSRHRRRRSALHGRSRVQEVHLRTDGRCRTRADVLSRRGAGAQRVDGLTETFWFGPTVVSQFSLLQVCNRVQLPPPQMRATFDALPLHASAPGVNGQSRGYPRRRFRWVRKGSSRLPRRLCLLSDPASGPVSATVESSGPSGTVASWFGRRRRPPSRRLRRPPRRCRSSRRSIRLLEPPLLPAPLLPLAPPSEPPSAGTGRSSSPAMLAQAETMRRLPAAASASQPYRLPPTGRLMSEPSTQPDTCSPQGFRARRTGRQEGRRRRLLLRAGRREKEHRPPPQRARRPR